MESDSDYRYRLIARAATGGKLWYESAPGVYAEWQFTGEHFVCGEPRPRLSWRAVVNGRQTETAFLPGNCPTQGASIRDWHLDPPQQKSERSETEGGHGPVKDDECPPLVGYCGRIMNDEDREADRKKAWEAYAETFVLANKLQEQLNDKQNECYGLRAKLVKLEAEATEGREIVRIQTDKLADIRAILDRSGEKEPEDWE